MLDSYFSNNNNNDPPSWDEIEATLRIQIDGYLQACNGAVTHSGECFVSTSEDTSGTLALKGNSFITITIGFLEARLLLDDPDFVFSKLFISRLRKIAEPYEKAHKTWEQH